MQFSLFTYLVAAQKIHRKKYLPSSKKLVRLRTISTQIFCATQRIDTPTVARCMLGIFFHNSCNIFSLAFRSISKSLWICSRIQSERSKMENSLSPGNVELCNLIAGIFKF
jgi:hypothetical protein